MPGDEDKPILLSIGYSACHWCHVMAHESFEDAAVAALMNDLFVNIKVDREERPDLDQIYQMAHAMLTQRSGGWPLTMFLTPDQAPFFGGTYFPKTPRYGLAGFARAAAAHRRGLSRAGRGDRRTDRAAQGGVGAHQSGSAGPGRGVAGRRLGARAGGARAVVRPRARRLRRRAEVSAPVRPRVLPAALRRARRFERA